MANRVFANAAEARRAVNALVDAKKYRVTAHASKDRPEISELEKVQIVRYGGGDKPDATRPPNSGVYVCWARHSSHGLCRGVYAVEDTSAGDIAVIITAFHE